ncbi:MAG: hypothetical protein ACE5J5_01205 [Candidatus Hydrothermarchaeales archaeon]
MVKNKEIELTEKEEWSGDGFKIRVVKWDLKNYKQKLEAKFEDKTETWYFGLYEKKNVVLFDGALTINDKGANFKNKIQKLIVETK